MTNIDKDEEALRIKARKIRDELNRIENKKRIDENKKHVGQCFKYRNSYGGSDDRERWWLYKKITGIDRYGYLSSISFEDDKCGRLNVHSNKMVISLDEYTPISKKGFNAALRSFKKKINAIEAA